MSSLLTKIKSKAQNVLQTEDKKTIKKSEAEPVITSQEENSLTDDQDIVFGGTLAISDESLQSPEAETKELMYTAPCEGNCTSTSSVTFDVISAEVLREGRSGHVNYTVLINPHKDSSRCKQSTIIRRYSDFENLHQKLKKTFPSILSNISFPRKIITGNFTSQTIAKRSVAFEQYLSHLFSQFEIRYSQEFLEFFLGDSYSDGVLYFLDRKFTAAIEEFERSLPILEKLYGDFHSCVCFCISALVSCYVSIDKPVQAHACVEVALRCCCTTGTSADEELQVALMLTAVRLCWTLGKEKQDLEDKISELKHRGLDVNTSPDLRDVLTSSFRLKHNVPVTK